MPYEVQTDVFEGPFDLLLRLILQQEVDIYEVSLSHIVDVYLEEMHRIVTALERQGHDAGGIDLERTTEFLLIAATLVELKTRRLLPDEVDGNLDDELGIWEERDLLLARLLECKTFKSAAVAIRQLAHRASFSYPRSAGPDERYLSLAPELLNGLSIQDGSDAFMRASASKQSARVDVAHIAPITASVTDAMFDLIDQLPKLEKTSFRQLTSGLADRIQVVVQFLAVLELFKQGHVELDQPERFGDITLTWIGNEDEVLLPTGVVSYDG